MIKMVEIDGKNILFKSNAATPIRYKQQTGSDFFADILKMQYLSPLIGAKPEDIPADVIDKLDFSVLYNVVWTLAKTADNSIPEPLTWFDSFDEFSILDILPEVMDLITSNLKSKKK